MPIQKIKCRRGRDELVNLGMSLDLFGMFFGECQMNVNIKLSTKGQMQARKNTTGIQILYPYDIVPPFAFNMREIVVTFITSIGNNNGFALDGERSTIAASALPSLRNLRG